MPPTVPQKRNRHPSPGPGPGPGSSGAKGAPATKRIKKTPVVPARKATLYDSIDIASTAASSLKNLSPSDILGGSSGDDGSSLSSLSDMEFTTVVKTALESKGKSAATGNLGSGGVEGGDEDDDDDGDEDDEEIVFEDVQTSFTPLLQDSEPSANLELTLDLDGRMSLTNEYGNKKGPSKRERITRNAVHRVHVMFLMWHNAVRNSWLCDPDVQGILISHIPPKLWEEYERWRRASGLGVAEEESGRKPKVAHTKGKGKEKSSRDWGNAARRLQSGDPDMSHGDPLFRLMKSLSAWWKQRFCVTAPGLRKKGYMSLERLDRLTKAFNSGHGDESLFGERIKGLEAFKTCAQKCTGSRDVGAQLFTALLRGLGLEARMVASLQPLGYGWSKFEDADPEQDRGSSQFATTVEPREADQRLPVEENKSPVKDKKRGRGQWTKKNPAVDTDELGLLEVNSDDENVVEIPKKLTPARKRFDQDLDFPHYWTEVLSPVTNKYLPVDAVVKFTVATNRELVESFEPRGGKTEKSRQVIAYVVGFSPDGTAKDVTIRYLKRQMLPGRTKGMRYPVEKVPVYNRQGKVKRYDQIDWIKSVLRGYARGRRKCPITDADEEEDATDLQPAKIEKKEVKEGEETLQYYKQSKDYVLERHLKREEALLEGAEPVKLFKAKCKGGEFSQENVYLRKDVVQVKSAETWHKQGRAPKDGERPLKMVPYRAATMNRKRDIAATEAATGQKVLQGLYSLAQTDWIIPPPIKNGIIPKNAFGNIDLFAEHMCPRGAVHVPFRGAVKVCRRLDIDYAEAVVDFEFGNRMAVPVIQGVVVAAEHHDRVMEELAKDEAERTRKEDAKRKAAALAMWRKMLMGMRITIRLREEYGDGAPVAPEPPRRAAPEARPAFDEDTAGGFLPAGFEEEAPGQAEALEDGTEDDQEAPRISSYFPVALEDDSDEDGGFVIEDGHANLVKPSASCGGGRSPRDEAPEASPCAPRSRRVDSDGANSPDQDSETEPLAARGKSSVAPISRGAAAAVPPVTRARSSRLAAAKANSKLLQDDTEL